MKRLNQYFFIAILTFFIVPVFYSCSPTRSVTTAEDYSNRRFILRDEGLSQLAYIDLANTNSNWYVAVPPGRDLQLVGNGRVLIGTGTGYEEREIATGKKVFEQTSYPGTLSARRLRNGNTLLAGLDWQGKKGIVLFEVDNSGIIKDMLSFPEFNYVRLVRETSSGTFLITAGTSVFEADKKGVILWRAKIAGVEKPNAWQALRVSKGQTIVSSGYSKNFQVFSKDGSLQSTITGPDNVHPNFYAGFQILSNGNYVVTNWQGHGPKFGASGVQLLEYSPGGKLVWSWKQDPEKFSSLQGVIVLNGLDINRMHVENSAGVLTPVE
jgi:hypothetical protein